MKGPQSSSASYCTNLTQPTVFPTATRINERGAIARKSWSFLPQIFPDAPAHSLCSHRKTNPILPVPVPGFNFQLPTKSSFWFLLGTSHDPRQPTLSRHQLTHYTFTQQSLLSVPQPHNTYPPPQSQCQTLKVSFSPLLRPAATHGGDYDIVTLRSSTTSSPA